MIRSAATRACRILCNRSSGCNNGKGADIGPLYS